jgi:NAD(P)-dependent dehydrogenase (short-subunit alcohol dehydrogenase family)
MTDVRGKVAVVTGAGSGIGRALAYELARLGAKVAVSDVDAAGLAETARQVELIGAPVHSQRLDVTDREAVLAYAAAVAEHFGQVNLIFNNAGIAFTGDIEDMTFEQIERVMDVDFWGVVNGTKAFLPYLIESGAGHVVNISSVFGLFSVPGQSAYNSAKFAVRGFTEALRQEMLVNSRPVAVTCVHPGGIKTAIARNAGAVEGHDVQQLAEVFDAKLAKTSPASAAKQILAAVKRESPRALIGYDAKVFDKIIRLVGPRYQRVLAAGARRLLPPQIAAPLKAVSEKAPARG